ncbi:MAG: ATP phosphoribosyltransferase [Myxococcota bacterium]|nr:ATP phosphoribosyltransferase [Myxococcota bacterium]MDW8362456.1 ATP phosphoribosyltransferase [Myxococcales bacterium]
MPEPESGGRRGGRPLVMALPKGRLLRALEPRLRRLGVPSEMLDESDRSLLRDVSDALRLLFVKPDDVPVYVAQGAADAGVVGRDVLLEQGQDVFAPLELGIGRCRLVVAGAPDLRLPTDRPVRVATRYPSLTAAHFRRSGRRVDVIELRGAVELAPSAGLCDLIVDLVETGETLRRNGLVERETILEVSAVVIANRVAMKLRAAALRRLLESLRDGAR